MTGMQFRIACKSKVKDIEGSVEHRISACANQNKPLLLN